MKTSSEGFQQCLQRAGDRQMREVRRMRSVALIGVMLALGSGACGDNGSPAAPTTPTTPTATIVRINGTWTLAITFTDYDGWECVNDSPSILPVDLRPAAATFTQDGGGIDVVFESGSTGTGSVSGNRVQFMLETHWLYLSDSRLPNPIGSIDNRATTGECGGFCEEEYVSSVFEATVTADGSMMVGGTWRAVLRVHPFGQPCTSTRSYSFTATREVS